MVIRQSPILQIYSVSAKSWYQNGYSLNYPLFVKLYKNENGFMDWRPVVIGINMCEQPVSGII